MLQLLRTMVNQQKDTQANQQQYKGSQETKVIQTASRIEYQGKQPCAIRDKIQHYDLRK